MVKQRHQLFAFLLCVSDAVVVALACVAAWLVRHSLVGLWWPRSWENYFKEPLIPLTVPLALLSMRFFGLYRPRRDRSMWHEQAQIVKASLAAVAVLVVVMWAMDSDFVSGGKGLGRVDIAGAFVEVERIQLACLAVFLLLAVGRPRAIFRLACRIRSRAGTLPRRDHRRRTPRPDRRPHALPQRVDRTARGPLHLPRAQGMPARPASTGRCTVGSTTWEHAWRPTTSTRDLPCPAQRPPRAETPGDLARLERFALDVRLIPRRPALGTCPNR